MTATTLFDGQEPTRDLLAQLVGSIDFGEALRRRAVQAAIDDALVWQLRRRAEVFDWARPRPGDYRGRATDADLAELDRRNAGRAEALRNRALGIERGWLA